MGLIRRGERPASWGEADILACFGDRSDYSDAGEAAAFAALGDRLDGARVLDLGVGAGRTTALVRERCGAYLGIDVTPEMVEIGRRRFPDADLRVADARDLRSICSDDAFDVVMFSFNGIDAVDHGGRIAVMEEARRVLAPGGLFLFSSLNIAGFSYDTRPWGQDELFDWVRVPRHPLRFVRSFRNYLRFRHGAEEGPDWSRRLLRSHEFRFLVHFASPSATVNLAERAGFRVVAAWAWDGGVIDLAHLDVDADYIHFLFEAVAV
jgi:ubiquinone/menaquinone biosynthesis C-methylase UbiE